ncbi:MAG TPA: hypothetical protein PKX08_09835 [Cyclobacteriaceae bacterium]|nr:hypothetical protein [Cyclobacteriaceae bacterium]
MELDQLKAVMIFQLENFNDEEVEKVDDDTIHSDVLCEDDGFGHINSVQIYKDVIRFTLVKQGHKLKAWPSNWLEISVAQLAPQIL